MPLKIVKASDPMRVQHVVVMVYGQPGVGKTSLGYTCDSPITLDFDNGAYRSAFRKDTVPVSAWEEVARLDAEELKGYKTVVVDTGGRALDKITAHLIQHNPKLSGNSGNLTLQGYGELKAVFANWLKMLKELGKDVLILAHDAEDKQGDDIIMRPDITGGSKQELIKVADAMGFMYAARTGRVLDFNNTDRWIAKNSAGFEPLRVPSFHEEPQWMAGIIGQIKEALNAESDEQRQAANEIAQWKKDVAQITDPQALSALIPTVNNHAQKAALRSIVWNHAKAMGWTYDKKSKTFSAPEPEGEPEAPEGGDVDTAAGARADAEQDAQ